MAKINNGLVMLFEFIAAIGAIIFLLGLCVGIFGWDMFITPELGVILGGILVLIGGFGLALYISKGDKEDQEKQNA
ncbi:hypothetical protein MmiHf6_06450 [Methanimicrococcus hongohii]|uniref:Uncharacterized protein n=1 Tax=Methanimicrococcus hongohii TaxID=3028295 RepID=A0AA96UZ69_9EURY|nr:hypothetical protein [Methanimicrococcus sp. Hf6]WNY23339.1 hypothetical protein MmiHf6_06450 [Methanimicrococcus sp. Hf6]